MACCQCQNRVSRLVLLGLTVFVWIYVIVCLGIWPTNLWESEALYRFFKAMKVFLTLGLSFAVVLVIVVVLFYPNRIMWNIYRVLISSCVVLNLLYILLSYFLSSYAYYTYEDETVLTFLTVTCFGGSMLLATSIMSCSVPLPDEPIFIQKIVKEGTDASGFNTNATPFDMSDSIPAMEGLDVVGPLIKSTVTDVPNKRTTVDEDAQGNKVITTKVVVMTCDATEPNVGDGAAPQASTHNSDNANMSAVPVGPVQVNDERWSNQIDDEEMGMANPYIRSQQEQRSNSRNTGFKAPDNVITATVVPVRAVGTTKSCQSEDEGPGMTYPYLSGHQELRSQGSRSQSQWPSSHASQEGDYAKPDDKESDPDMDPELALALRVSMEEERVRQQRAAVPLSSSTGDYPKFTSQEHQMSSRSLVRVGGRPDSSGIDKPPTRESNALSGYLEDTSSSAFTDSGNYGDSYAASSSTFGESFAESSGHLLADGTEGELKAPKKKKKKKKHKHRSSEHRNSSKHQKESRVRSEAAESGNDIAARGGE